MYLTTPNFDSGSRYLLSQRWRAIEPEHRCLFNPRTAARVLTTGGVSAVRIVTKNIDLPEIVAKWTRRPSAGERVSTTEATAVFRAVVEDSALLRWAKVMVNGVLRLSTLGETLDVLALKR